MSSLANFLSSLAPWLLAMTLFCALVVLLVRYCAEPFAPGIAFGPLVRRLVNRRPLETEPSEFDDSIANRQLRRRLRRNEWAFHAQLRVVVWIMCVMLLSRTLILASAMVGSCLTGSLDILFQAAISHWVRWDAASYINLARNGYFALPGLLNFLPLYPLLVRIFAFLTFGHYVFSGFLVSNISLLGAGWALYRIMTIQYGERTARRAVLLMMFSPLSVVLSLPYAESLFLMLTLMSVLCARNKAFLPAAIFGMFASLTRLIGVLVFIPVFLEALKYLHGLHLFHRNRPRFRGLLLTHTLICLTIPLGTVIYMVLNQIVAGNPFAFVNTLATEWSQTPANILNTQRYSINLAFNYGNIVWQLGTWLPQALAIFVAALMILSASTTIEPGDGLYGWLYLVLTMMPSWLLSGVRTITVMYPLYMILAVVSRNKWTYLALMLSSIILMCFFSYMYALAGCVV